MFKIGDKVVNKVIPEDKYEYPHFSNFMIGMIGQVGEVTEVEFETSCVQVLFDNGDDWWYHTKWLELHQPASGTEPGKKWRFRDFSL